MKIIGFLILSLIEKTLGTLYYDSGYSNLWRYATIPADTTQEQTITFSQQFSRVPQVSINPIIMQDSFENKSNSGHQILILQQPHQILQQNYTFQALPIPFHFQHLIGQLLMALEQRFYKILMRLIHKQNSRASAGTSFHGSTKLDFTISLEIITTTTVEVNIVQSNMISLGYIAILGPSEFFDIEAQIFQLPKNQYDSDVYYSKTVAKVPNIIRSFFPFKKQLITKHFCNRVWLFFLQQFYFLILIRHSDYNYILLMRILNQYPLHINFALGYILKIVFHNVLINVHL